jgi:hypothetical protein
MWLIYPYWQITISAFGGLFSQIADDLASMIARFSGSNITIRLY